MSTTIVDPHGQLRDLTDHLDQRLEWLDGWLSRLRRELDAGSSPAFAAGALQYHADRLNRQAIEIRRLTADR